MLDARCSLLVAHCSLLIALRLGTRERFDSSLTVGQNQTEQGECDEGNDAFLRLASCVVRRASCVLCASRVVCRCALCVLLLGDDRNMEDSRTQARRYK